MRQGSWLLDAQKREPIATLKDTRVATGVAWEGEVWLGGIREFGNVRRAWVGKIDPESRGFVEETLGGTLSRIHSICPISSSLIGIGLGNSGSAEVLVMDRSLSTVHRQKILSSSGSRAPVLAMHGPNLLVGAAESEGIRFFKASSDASSLAEIAHVRFPGQFLEVNSVLSLASDRTLFSGIAYDRGGKAAWVIEVVGDEARQPRIVRAGRGDRVESLHMRGESKRGLELVLTGTPHSITRVPYYVVAGVLTQAGKWIPKARFEGFCATALSKGRDRVLGWRTPSDAPQKVFPGEIDLANGRITMHRSPTNSASLVAEIDLPAGQSILVGKGGRNPGWALHR